MLGTIEFALQIISTIGVVGIVKMAITMERRFTRLETKLEDLPCQGKTLLKGCNQ